MDLGSFPTSIGLIKLVHAKRKLVGGVLDCSPLVLEASWRARWLGYILEKIHPNPLQKTHDNLIIPTEINLQFSKNDLHNLKSSILL